MVTRKDVIHIADLAKLDFSEEELEKFADEFSKILEYVSQLREVDTEGIEPTFSISAKIQPLREDVVKPSLPKEEVLKNAPEEQYGYFKLPRMIMD
ncbi:MAG: Asp-tRNA(Asn)/Glu-tRNA(Gln) amidotransferase subunit GatC [Tissierellales bacterium]